jgi:hypothetical protein
LSRVTVVQPLTRQVWLEVFVTVIIARTVEPVLSGFWAVTATVTSPEPQDAVFFAGLAVDPAALPPPAADEAEADGVGDAEAAGDEEARESAAGVQPVAVAAISRAGPAANRTREPKLRMTSSPFVVKLGSL